MNPMKKYILSFISLTFLSCVSDNDFSTPDVCRGGQCKATAELSKAPIPFNETFDNDFALWQVANTKGERKWYLTQHDGKPFATMSAFDGQNQPGVSVESWLISPLFDFDAQENETLEFKLADYYSNDNPLKVFYSTDYDGANIKKATWSELTPPNTLFNNPKRADYNFESSGDIDLSGIKGKAVIAFVYDSNEGKITSTAQLSEVHITVGKKEEAKPPKSLQSAAIPFNETFDNGTNSWQIENTQDTRKWLKKDHEGVNYAQMNAYGGKDKPGVDVKSWLISPQFNFDGQESESLEFKLADAYSNGNPLKVMYSSDYDGANIDKATWKELTVPNNLFNNTKAYDYNFESSGDIDLSGISGKAVIAFVYDSNGGKITSTAQLSEVHITSSGKKQTAKQSTIQLIISEYVEGSSYNKYIELYNPTENPIDLSAYTLSKDYNGDNNYKTKGILSGTLGAKQTIVYANSKATIYTGTVNKSITDVINFNGNDQLALMKGGVIIDQIGKPGNIDFAKDVTLRRKATINAPSATWSESEWDTKSKDDVSGLGSR